MRSGGALRIGEPRQRRAASPAFQCAVRPKKEPAPVEEEQEEEWPGLKEAEEASFNTVQPAPVGFAEDWSLGDFTAKELEIGRAHV